MPELPEVQTTVNGINKYVKGLTIKSVWTDAAGLIKGKSFGEFEKEIVGRKIEEAERRGKNVLISLSGGKTLRVHLKMTGHLMYGVRDAYVHIVFELSDGKQLALSDLRKFAKVELFDTDKPTKDLLELGPEPMTREFDFETFHKLLLKKPRGKIKQVLVDQNIISGIGNIYSDEILWEAGIHPLSQVSKIPEDKVRAAYAAMRKILSEALELGGDSMTDYRDVLGRKGKYQEHHRAYRQTGLPCKKKDGGEIHRIVIGGRSSHFCPAHQTLYN
jgi:formamidopyrimidine-DNA glycosylase